MQYAYVMRARDKDPTGLGDTESWFNFYKWESEDEVFVPDLEGALKDAVPGDTLWFLMDGIVYGAVEILRVDDGPKGERELWYDASKKRKSARVDLLTEYKQRLRAGWCMPDLLLSGGPLSYLQTEVLRLSFFDLPSSPQKEVDK